MPDVIIFDGLCNLCAGSVQFILKNEACAHYVFASAQSVAGAQLMRQHGLDPADPKTFLVIEDNCAYVRSDAALCIARHLRMPWSLLRWVRIVPRPLRNWGYDVIARHRYSWFGRKQQCWLPNAAYAKRFLE
jgi:predicted DCC family thiol-disulfide oxidoreductase YuxK